MNLNKFIAKRNNVIFYTSNEMGLKPILSKINIDSLYFKNADIEDTIIGKAAASLLVLSNVHSIHAHTISKSGKKFINKYNIKLIYDQEVEEIRNRDNTDMCPLEKTVLNIDDPVQAKKALKIKIKEMKKNVSED